MISPLAVPFPTIPPIGGVEIATARAGFYKHERDDLVPVPKQLLRGVCLRLIHHFRLCRHQRQAEQQQKNRYFFHVKTNLPSMVWPLALCWSDR